jgi:hypothetical protein
MCSRRKLIRVSFDESVRFDVLVLRFGKQGTTTNNLAGERAFLRTFRRSRFPHLYLPDSPANP